VDYLSFDSLASGVAASQVAPYVVRLRALGVPVTVHSFEPDQGVPPAARAITDAGAEWCPSSFGRHGAVGGLDRMFRAAWRLRAARVIHARSDLAAGAAMLARPRSWVWDVRSLWADQRIALGMMTAGGPEDRVMRVIESRAVRQATHVVTLTAAVIPEIERRHGVSLADRATVIPTCVDLAHFRPSPLPAEAPVLMLSGTLNAYYDVPLMLRFHAAVRRRVGAELLVVAPGATRWDAELASAGAEVTSSAPEVMPGVVARAHAGLSVCRHDAGVSLRAAMPTKIGEFLAAGRPVVINTGLGDMDEILAEVPVGVAIPDSSQDAVEEAADTLCELLADPATPERCRQAAERWFDVDEGARRLADVYSRIS
jgi:glycosyltransferase involved in cell wall biosynthesis